MLRVAVCFKALCDPVSDLQQACACVLELLLVGKTLIRFVQLLKGLLHRPHALLTLHTGDVYAKAQIEINRHISLNRLLNLQY